ncbi:2-phospho-L-lactate guanylyltransferase [Microlunatus speluncae]|uniref:2-phospho-L-lactate guanylyltransferase n=1 Tax=Microlunatus speluncae TaxID=2594267 RepID=UPI00137607CA|nr:2-phospho-L-lactate guanylyltransferase [Microlunatus speluncae]
MERSPRLIHPADQADRQPPELGAVVAIKPLGQAKTRLATVPGPLRRELVLAMLLDTVRVLSGVARTVIVTAEPGLGRRFDDHGLTVQIVQETEPTGLNQALRAGAEALQQQGIRRVLACVADLPALRAETLRGVIAAAGPHPRSFLADADGVGTTMLIADGVALDPRFGPGSAAAHRDSGAVPLLDDAIGRSVPDARRDVDTEDDLAEIGRYDLGPETRAVLNGWTRTA